MSAASKLYSISKLAPASVFRVFQYARDVSHASPLGAFSFPWMYVTPCFFFSNVSISSLLFLLASFHFFRFSFLATTYRLRNSLQELILYIFDDISYHSTSFFWVSYFFSKFFKISYFEYSSTNDMIEKWPLSWLADQLFLSVEFKAEVLLERMILPVMDELVRCHEYVPPANCAKLPG